jgi:hypothetical protein
LIPEEIRAKYPHLASCLLALLGPEPVAIASESKTQILVELGSLLVCSESLAAVVQMLLQDAPKSEDLLQFGIRAYRVLGAGEDVKRFVGRVWAHAMSAWGSNERTQFLQLTVTNPHTVFYALDLTAEMLEHVDLTADETLPWILKAYSAISRDLMQRGFWMSIRAFCHRSPSEAVVVIQNWLGQAPDDTGCKVLARMVGYVRSAVLSNVRAAEQFEALERLLSTGHPTWQAIWIRSWAENLQGLDEQKALEIRGPSIHSGSEKQSAWIYLLCAMALENHSAWQWIIRELRANASSNLRSEPRYRIMTTALQGIETTAGEFVPQWQQLLEAIMPINAEEDGLWEAIEYHWADQANKNPEILRSVINELGRLSGTTFIQQLHAGKLSYLISVLTEKGIHRAICSDLCFSMATSARKLGLLLFAECGVDQLDETAIREANSVQLELLLLEAQRTTIDYAALARLHASLASQVDELGTELQLVFYDEVAIQGLNTHAYREALAREASNNEYIQAILEDVRQRLEETGKAFASPALQMDVPGRNSAEMLSQQRMARDVAKGIKQRSMFLNLVRRVTLLYGGQSWRIFMPDGSLGESSPMHSSSTTVEVPRMELFDLEGMHLRRLEASARIAKLEADALPGDAR